MNSVQPRAPAPAARKTSAAGLFLLGAAATGIGAFGWILASSFLPFARTEDLEYVFIGAPPLVFAALTVTAGIGLAAVHRRAIADPAEPRWSGGSLGYQTPLALLWLAPAGTLALLPNAGPRLSALTYVLVDLRPWWASALIGTWLLLLDRKRGSPWRNGVERVAHRLSAAGRLFVLDALLFALLLAHALFSNTHLRFTAVLHGDEPKYVRLCENWYQGLGLDVSHQQTMKDLGLAYSPPLWRNIALFADAVRKDAAFLAADARTFLEHGFSISYNRGRYVDGWFLHGRNGGFYQVHNPGLSMVLFPAYFVDRHFFATSAGYQDIFPTDLPVTNLLLLFIWAAWGVAVFRLLHAVTRSQRIAWLLAATAMLTMPVSAFAFQIYPETLGGMIVTLSTLWLLYRHPDDAPLRAALAVGGAAGFLPWLHVRFILVSAVLAGWSLLMLRRRRLAFLAAYAIVMFGLCLYSYHLTGSLRPDAMYETEGGSAPWRLRDALESAISYPLDRIWGFLPHAPVYLFALPGWALAARHAPRAALLSALLIASLVIPSSGHGFSAAGATPLRHLVAVVPLAMIPLALTVQLFGGRRWVHVAFAILLVISLDSALSYNLVHRKETGRMIDMGVSGWTPNLLFPWTHGMAWAQWQGTYVLFLAWAATTSALLLIPLLGTPRRVSHRAGLRHYAAGAAVFVLIATAATALGGERVRGDYFIPIAEARARTIEFAERLDRCRVCYSSTRGEVGRSELVVDTDFFFDFLASAGEIRAGEEVAFTGIATVRDGHGWGNLAVSFGDDGTGRVEVYGSGTLRHAYRTPGERRVTARFTFNGGVVMQRVVTVMVLPAAVSMDDVLDLPDLVRHAPVRGTISSVQLGPGGVRVHLAGETQLPEAWLLTWDGARWHAQRANSGPVKHGSWIAVFAAASDGSVRSAPVMVLWPEPALAFGSPVVLYWAERAGEGRPRR